MSSDSRLSLYKEWRKRTQTEEELFLKNIIKTATCWWWKGSVNHSGYVHIRIKGKKIYGHRYSYELFKEKIPDGMILHHTCKRRECLNPDHMIPVTREEHPGVGAPKGNHNRGGYRAYIAKQNLSN